MYNMAVVMEDISYFPRRLWYPTMIDDIIDV